MSAFSSKVSGVEYRVRQNHSLRDTHTQHARTHKHTHTLEWDRDREREWTKKMKQIPKAKLFSTRNREPCVRDTVWFTDVRELRAKPKTRPQGAEANKTMAIPWTLNETQDTTDGIFCQKYKKNKSNQKKINLKKK